MLSKTVLFFLSRDRDSGYYRVLAHYYPEDSEEMAVKDSTILFVLRKGADGWATAIYDGQVCGTGRLALLSLAQHGK